MLTILGRTVLALKRLNNLLVGLAILVAVVFSSLILLASPSTAASAQSQLEQTVTVTAVSTTFAAPTPTVPSWSRPNLHLYFFDEQDRSLASVKVCIYEESYNAATKKLEVRSVLTGVSDVQGRASFDVTRLMPGVYYLELREADGNLVLPKDPDLFVPGQSVGQPQQNPALTYMTGLDLNYGSVVYVKQYQLRLLLKPFEATPAPVPTSVITGTSQLTPQVQKPGMSIKASRAIYWPQSKQYIYYPPFGTDLAGVGNGGTGTTPPVSVSGASNSPGATSSSSGSSFVPGNGTSIVQPGLRGMPNTPTPASQQGSEASVLATAVLTTSIPTATVTPVECRGCLSPGASPDSPATLTARAGSGLDAGRGGSGRLTSTPIPSGVLTQRAEAAQRRTATALAGFSPSGTELGGNLAVAVPTVSNPERPVSTSMAAPGSISGTETPGSSSGNSLTLTIPTPAFSVQAEVATSEGTQGQPTPSTAISISGKPRNGPIDNTGASWVDWLILITEGLAVIGLVAGGGYVGWYWRKYQRLPWQ